MKKVSFFHNTWKIVSAKLKVRVIFYYFLVDAIGKLELSPKIFDH